MFSKKSNKAIEKDAVSAAASEVLLPVIVFVQYEYNNLSLWRGCFSKCLNGAAKVYPFQQSGCKHNIKKYRSISKLPVIIKVFQETMYERLCSVFDEKE